jgi:sucrose-phosphate synthase
MSEASRFLADPRKPIILALSRPDARKNITTLIRAYGENERLREIANLGLVMGVRDDIRAMEKGPREVLSEVLLLIDYYDLHGSVAYPKQHDPDDVPLFYQLAAKTRGVFVNPALSEPFGLTLIEAAASGLPVVATEDGGPRDILADCKNGLLVDPLDSEGMGAALLDAMSDRERWRRWSRNGVAGARRCFSWSAHVNKYMRLVRATVTQHEKRRIGSGSRRRLIAADRILLCDIDNTLIGDQAGLAELLRRLDEASSEIIFGVATGRSLELTRQVLKEWKLPTPQLLITSVGTDLHYGPHLIEDPGWEMVIRHRWSPDDIRRVMTGVPGLRLQPPEGQDEYKISYLVDPDKAPGRKEIVRILRQADLQASVVYSHGQFLDVLPIRASKGKALRYFAVKWNIPIERCLVAGDSGNDEEMLTGNTLGVVVGNHDQDLEKLKGHPRIYFAEGHHAWGILEGIDQYDFLGSLRIPGQEQLADDRSAYQLSQRTS